MAKKRRYSHRYFLLNYGNVIGVLMAVCLIFVRLSQAVRRAVPDTYGTTFWFTTPLCSAQFPANLHVVPQTLDAVNVTIESLDDSVFLSNTSYTIATDTALFISLPCPSFQWGQLFSSGFTVSATSEVALYIEYKDDSHVIFPNDVIGHKHIVTSLTFSGYSDAFIVLQGNGSAIELTLPPDLQSTVEIEGVTYTNGTKTNITLPTNGVLGILCSCDLTGATITSDLPLIVLTGAIKSSSSDGFIEQAAPVGSWGRRFVLVAHSWMDHNITIVITGEHNDTVVTINNGETVTSSQFSGTTTMSIQLQLKDFVSIDTDTSVTCAVLYTLVDKLSARHIAFKYLVPVILYHLDYNFRMQTGEYDDELSTNIVIKQASFQHLTFNKTNSNPFEQAMIYFWKYFICQNIALAYPSAIKTSDKNSVPFHATVFRRNNHSAYEYSLGMRITNVYNACVEHSVAHGGNGDGIDNDCDNSIDEEKLNKLDDDHDGIVDEDVQYAGKMVAKSGETVWEYHLRNKEKKETGVPISVISIVISIGVSLTSVLCFIGGMLLADRIRRNNNATRVTPIY